MEMRSGARAAPIWDHRCFLRGYGGFYAQAMGIQEENQIGRGAAQNSVCKFRAFWPVPIYIFWSTGLSNRGNRSLVQ